MGKTGCDGSDVGCNAPVISQAHSALRAVVLAWLRCGAGSWCCRLGVSGRVWPAGFCIGVAVARKVDAAERQGATLWRRLPRQGGRRKVRAPAPPFCAGYSAVARERAGTICQIATTLRCEGGIEARPGGLSIIYYVRRRGYGRFSSRPGPGRAARRATLGMRLGGAAFHPKARGERSPGSVAA
jgi:hypothetical protein